VVIDNLILVQGIEDYEIDVSSDEELKIKHILSV
jgi:hypothetical protein